MSEFGLKEILFQKAISKLGTKNGQEISKIILTSDYDRRDYPIMENKPITPIDRSQDLAFSLSLIPKEKLKNLRDFQVGDFVVKIGATENKNGPDYSYMSRVCIIKEFGKDVVVVNEVLGSQWNGFYKINYLSVYPIRGDFLENWGSIHDLSEPHRSEVFSLFIQE